MQLGVFLLAVLAPIQVLTQSDDLLEYISTEDAAVDSRPTLLASDIEEASSGGDNDWWLPEDPPPASWDCRDSKYPITTPIYQGGCGSCGFISGVQTLEARVASVAENYVSYSIQNVMNCDGRICKGTQPFRTTTLSRNQGFIAGRDTLDYTKGECLNKGPPDCLCYGYNNRTSRNVLDDQFVVIGPTVKVWHAWDEEQGEELSEEMRRELRKESEAEGLERLRSALQQGPVTTCYTRTGLRVENAERDVKAKCLKGCDHANSIIGFDGEKLLVQESYGKKWGPTGDGTWFSQFDEWAPGTTMEDREYDYKQYKRCIPALLEKAYFPKIFYDYDRANAYYQEISGEGINPELLPEDEKLYLSAEDKVNVGRAKNRCAFLGAICKGVVEIRTGPVEGPGEEVEIGPGEEEEVPSQFELVADWHPKKKGILKEDFEGCTPKSHCTIAIVRVFEKTQMVVYLQNQGKYLKINGKIKTKKSGKNRVKAIVKARTSFTDKGDEAAAFFLSYGRLIYYEQPQYHLLDDSFAEIGVDPKNSWEAPGKDAWMLDECNLRKEETGKSLDISSVEEGGVQYALSSSDTDLESESQRFRLGLSGAWSLTSNKLNTHCEQNKKTKKRGFNMNQVKLTDKKTALFRWNARQLLTGTGQAPDGDLKFDAETGTWFELSLEPDKAVHPTKCRLVKKRDVTEWLMVKGSKLKMGGAGGEAGRWNLVYGSRGKK